MKPVVRHALASGLPVIAALALGWWIGAWMAVPPENGPAPPAPSSTAGHDHGGSPAPDDHAGHDHDAADPAEVVDVVEWICPMHPTIRQDEFGTCPICGMDLVQVTRGPADSAGLVALSEDARVLAGIRTVAARREHLTREVTLVGRVALDETRVSRVAAWYGGRIEDLHVDFVGAEVERGDRLFTIYSPELLVAQRELIEAARYAARAGRPGAHPTADAAHRALEATRERLSLWGLSNYQIDRVVKTGKAQRNLTVYAPRDGTVVTTPERAGSYVKEGTVVFTIADLSTVWLELDAFERDLPWVAIGQRVTFESLATPGESFSGEISFIAPTIDAERRTATVRVAVTDAARRLKPGGFIKARVHAPLPGPAPVVVPDSAPLVAGDRAILFVADTAADEPTYVLREVRLGARAAGLWAVVEGLEEGEQVVAEGAFKLDSALQIRGDRSLMHTPAGDDGAAAASGAAAADATPEDRLHWAVEHLAAGDLDAATQRALDTLMPAILELSAALAADEPERSASAARAVATGVAALGPTVPAELLDAARDLAAPDATMAARRATLGAVNAVLVPLVVRNRAGLETPFEVTWCPMAFDDAGAFWLQADGAVANPYYGAEMLRCGFHIDQGVVVDVAPPEATP